MEHFPRTALAQQIANDLLGLSFLSDAPNGLFLAAPRRTGKSTFLHIAGLLEKPQSNCLKKR